MNDVIPFPRRHSRGIQILREQDNYGTSWLVLCPNGHGWLHGSRSHAVSDAEWLSDNYGVGIIDRSSAIKQGMEHVS